jgi:uncharacterized protein YbjT (DUF2867 family)
MRIAVMGGTGFIGTKLVDQLNAEGHTATGHSLSTGVDLLTGEGVADALRGVEAVVNTIDAPSFDEAASDFFRTTSENLLAAAERARVGHVVLLSIVGIDHIPDVAYYRAKLLQESILEGGLLPYSIVRATQFMEFIDGILSWTTEEDTVRLPTTPLQPIAAAEVVGVLTDIATGRPLNGVLSIAGPDIVPLEQLGRITVEAGDGDRQVVVDESAGLFAAVPGNAATAPQNAHLAHTHYTDWLTHPT